MLRGITYAAGAIGAGCRPNTNVPGARVTLTQWYHQYGEKGTEDAVHRYAQEYTRLHPDVATQAVWVPGDYGTKLSTALLTPGGPDIFEGTISLPMVEAGQVVAVDDLFTPAIRADFNPKDIAANTVNGKVYSVKMIDDLGLLYYRKSVLSATISAPPTGDWQTWTTQTATLDHKEKGLHTLCLVFTGGAGNLFNIEWFAVN